MHVLLVRYDDWQEMFIDGCSVTQGHSVSAKDALCLCGIDVVTRPATKAEEIALTGYDPELAP